MCGIAGFRVFDGLGAAHAQRLPAALDSLKHRGPDDHGVWIAPGGDAGLGQRRLSIIDLSAFGHQPMFSACGQWAMVFNGEMYNFREVRSQLEALGHRFRGTGDSEVLVEAVAEWGLQAFDRFIGMFAVALWHVPTKQLHLVRDRLGVKPLYYRWDGRRLLFGSELKALRAFDGWTPEIDRDAVGDFLRYGYIAEPRSIYRDVFKLPPAHRLVLDAQGRVELHRYWNALDHLGRRAHGQEDALADELEALMIDAFNYRMVADVPVGVFLSGGIDSSVVAALLSKSSPRPIKTFTIGFDQHDYDESAYAAEVARHLGAEHHARTLRADDAKQLLPRWGELFDEPFGDASGLPTLLVSQVAAEQVKVVLSADGGDELFSGYSTYGTALSQWDRVNSVPRPLRSLAQDVLRGAGVQALAEHLKSDVGVVGLTATRVANIANGIAAESAAELFDTLVAHFPLAELNQLLGKAVPRRTLANAYPGSPGEQLCLWDLHHYLPADVLAKVDRATMAVSIEGREPLLDHRLVEFALSLPFEMRRGPLGSKHLLKKVLYRHVPRSLVDRPKQGFGVPVRQWLAEDLSPLLDEHLEPGRLAAQGLFDPAMVQGYVRRLRRGDRTVAQRLWLLVAFQLWHRRWMEAA